MHIADQKIYQTLDLWMAMPAGLVAEVEAGVEAEEMPALLLQIWGSFLDMVLFVCLHAWVWICALSLLHVETLHELMNNDWLY